MSVNHTPSPWTVDQASSARQFSVRGRQVQVARICITKDSVYRAEGLANARLIAAAPDLKDALKDLLRHYVQLVNSGDAGNWDPETEIVVKDARKALSQASGEAA